MLGAEFVEEKLVLIDFLFGREIYVVLFKRKRKPKPKITDTAKEDFQKTLNEFAQGNYPPIDIPDITKIHSFFKRFKTIKCITNSNYNYNYLCMVKNYIV
jgi:hypothetical protein